MLEIELNLKGNLAGQLDHYLQEVQEKVLFSGVAGMARVIYNEAKNYAEPHVKSGLLLSAIYRRYVKSKSTKDRKTYDISWNRSMAPHGHLIEFGTSHAPAYPFIRPAFSHIDEAISFGMDRMQASLEEVSSAK
jgi:HK97 gp10 family phage protein